jgi:hypothetical protein
VAPNLIGAGRRQCNVVDCRPPAPAPAKNTIPRLAQSIEYMAKDYDSFLRGMLDLIPSRLPGWKTRTEADLGMALLELFAYVGDALSYYQDRVANEGFLRSALEYESVRRLLSLIDYQIQPGMAAKAILKVEVKPLRSKAILKGFSVTTKSTDKQTPVAFEAVAERVVYEQLNDIAFTADVPANATQAVLKGELDLLLFPGLWMHLESPANAEWVQLAAPIPVNHLLHTTTVHFVSPLQGSYQAAATHINGNGVVASHGQSQKQTATGNGLPNQQMALNFAPLTYVQAPNGQVQSSLVVKVAGKPWRQVEDFIDSEATDLHFTLPQDNFGFATVKFGTGQQGRRPEPGEPIEVRYRNGIGEAGMVASDSLTEYDDPDDAIQSITNPEASFGARDADDLAEAKLLGPRNIHHQNRAVTAQDYADALLAGVPSGMSIIRPLHAKAQFLWTGSWNSVVVSVDFADRQPLATQPERRAALENALEARRIAGYDVQVEDARYAPMNICLVVHIKPEYFVRQVRTEVENAIGPLGFFTPSHFSFGDAVRLSDLYSVVLGVEGVRYIAVQRFKRLGDRYPDHSKDGVVEINPLEIARCDNDSVHPENGVISVRICGGKEG